MGLVEIWRSRIRVVRNAYCKFISIFLYLRVMTYDVRLKPMTDGLLKTLGVKC